MNRVVLFLIVAVSVVLAIAIVGFIATGTNPAAPCRFQFETLSVHVINSTSAWVPVFLTNSTSTVCVKYSPSVPSPFTPFVGQLSNGVYSPSANLTVKGEVRTRPSLVPAGEANAVFSLSVEKNTKGIFDVALTHPCNGPEILLAVGYGPHELNDTTLRIPIQVTSCPSSPPRGEIVGTSNLSMVWVRVVATP